MIKAHLYRTVTVPTEHLKGIVALELDSNNDVADRKIKEAYGPHFAPGFRIFWSREATIRKTVVGMEVMAFDVSDSKVAQSADLVICDPIYPEAIHRIDGALQSELRRMGIYVTEVEDHEWRMWVEKKP